MLVPSWPRVTSSNGQYLALRRFTETQEHRTQRNRRDSLMLYGEDVYNFLTHDRFDVVEDNRQNA